MVEQWRVLVAGCGYVGSALAERLVRAGHSVWGLRRRPAGLPEGVVPVPADLGDPGSLRSLPAGLDFVVYTAAADGSEEGAYRAAYVDGLRNLLDALREQGQSPRRVVFTSSTAVYGQQHGEWVDESSPTDPRGFRGQIMLEGERLVRQGVYPGTSLRLGGIYGPDRSRVIDQVRRGDAICSPRPVYSNRIHRDDCAGALHHLLALPKPEAVYLGVDREPADICEVYHWLAAELGVSMPLTAAEAGTPRGSNKRCNSDWLVSSGYRFKYPSYREGLASLL
ncbi:SDR family oxidoreductase [soil metagenome]